MSKDAAFFANYDFSRFRILTPKDQSSGGPQENLLMVSEPTSMFLLGAGLIGLGARLRVVVRPKLKQLSRTCRLCVVHDSLRDHAFSFL
jgi:hypothetical protein